MEICFRFWSKPTNLGKLETVQVLEFADPFANLKKLTYATIGHVGVQLFGIYIQKGKNRHYPHLA